MHKTVVFRTVVPLRADDLTDNTEYGFYFDVIDSSLVGEPEERASAAKHKIKVGITYELLTNWRLDNASEDDLVRILFHYARRYVEQKIKDGTLTDYEELLLSTEEHREGDCPLDISRIPDPVGFTADIAVDYALEKLVKLIPESPALAQPMKEQPEQIQKDFFISYNSVDHQWAEWIAWQLEEAGYTTVLQAWDFRPGSNFVLEMQRAAKEVERTIAVLSQAYLDALYTQSEWAAAFARDPTGEKGTLLPVRVQECDLEGLLPQIVYIDLVGLDEAASKDVLLTGVRRERAKPTVAPSFPGGAPRSVPERPRFPRALPLPDLKLLWRGDRATGPEGSSLVLETSEYNDKHFYLLLFARNDGEAMTAWYRLSFDIPRELARPGSNLHVVQWHKGEQTCWSAGVSAEMTHHEFKSAAQYPLFPGDEVHIATLEVHLLSQIDYPDEVRIPYSVVTDRTQIQHGECMIKIRPENLTRKTSQ